MIVSDLLTLIPTKRATRRDRVKNGTKVLIILFFRFISLLYFIDSFILCPFLDFNFDLENTKIPLLILTIKVL